MAKETTTEKAPRKQFMKWLKLGEDKDPEFEKTVFLFDENEKVVPGHEFDIGRLTSKTSNAAGFKYGFVTITSERDDEHPEETRFTHYCNPVKP